MATILPFAPTAAPKAPSRSQMLGAFRQRVAEEIERLVDLLDEIDGDPDAEPDADDEPSLGWTKTMATGDTMDLEDDESL